MCCVWKVLACILSANDISFPARVVQKYCPAYICVQNLVLFAPFLTGKIIAQRKNDEKKTKVKKRLSYIQSYIAKSYSVAG